MIGQINRLGEIWWSWMWPMFWQAALLVALVAIVDLIVRKRVWPQVRYALWLLVMLKLMLPPGLALRTSVTSQLQPIATEALKYQLLDDAEIEAFRTDEFVPAAPVLDTSLIAKRPLPYELPITAAAQPKAPMIEPESAGAEQPVRKSWPKLGWHSYVMAVWALGVWLLGGWLVFRLRNLRTAHRQSAGATKPPQWFMDLAADAADKLKLSCLPEVVLSRRVVSPAVFGVIRPVLLMPAKNISRFSRSEIEHILLHELAHIKRRDLKVHAVYMVLQVVYWFNPLLWLVRRQLQHLRELCCDATVAWILRERTVDYRETILETARRLLARPVEPGLGLLGLFEDSSRLRVRLKWLEKKTWKHRRLRVVTVFAVIAFMCACVLPMASVKKPAWSEKDLLIKFAQPEGDQRDVQQTRTKQSLMYRKSWDVSFKKGEQLLVIAELYQAGRAKEELGRKIFTAGASPRKLTAEIMRRYVSNDQTSVQLSAKVNMGWRNLRIDDHRVHLPKPTKGSYHDDLNYFGEQGLKEYSYFGNLMLFSAHDSRRGVGEVKMRIEGTESITPVSRYALVLKMVPVSQLEHVPNPPHLYGEVQEPDGRIVPNCIYGSDEEYRELENDVKVKFIGVRKGREGDSWWSMDGKRRFERSYEDAEVTSWMEFPPWNREEFNEYTFLAQLDGMNEQTQKAASRRVSWRSVPRAKDFSYSAWVDDSADGDMSFTYSHGLFAKDLKSARVFLSVSGKEWETIYRGTGGDRVIIDGLPLDVEKPNDRGTSTRIKFLLGRVFNIRNQLRIIAIDNNEKEHVAKMSVGQDLRNGHFDGLKTSDIKEYQLQRRKRYWVCFKDVALEPDHGTFRGNAQRTGVYDSRAVREFGRVKWKFSTEGQPHHMVDPVVAGGTVYYHHVGVHSRVDSLYAIDTESGALKWKFETKTKASYAGGSTPAIANGTVYYNSYDKYLYALEAETGKVKWKRELGQGYSPVVVGDTVYFAVFQGSLFALDASSGEEKWKQGNKIMSSPSVANGAVFYSGGVMVADDWYVCKVDAKTGRQYWKKDAPAAGTPCIADGVVYFRMWRKMRLFALDEATGKIKWKFDSPYASARIPLSSMLMGGSSPAVSKGIVCFGGLDSPLHALDARTGKSKWKNNAYVYGSPAVAEDVVYFGGLDKHLYAADIKSGELLWQFQADSPIEASPVIDDGVIYAADTGGNLYAIEGPDAAVEEQPESADEIEELLESAVVEIDLEKGRGEAGYRTASDMVHGFLELAREGDPGAGELFAERMSQECVRLLEWYGGPKAAAEMSREFQRLRADLSAPATEEQKQFYRNVRIRQDRSSDVTERNGKAYTRLLNTKARKKWSPTLLLRRDRDGQWRIVGLYDRAASLSSGYAKEDFLISSPATHPAWGDAVELRVSAEDIAKGAYIDFDNRKLYMGHTAPAGDVDKQWLIENGIDGKCGSKAVGGGGGLEGYDLVHGSGGREWGVLTTANVQLLSKHFRRFGAGGGGYFLFKTREGNIGTFIVSGDAQNYLIRFKMLDPSYLEPDKVLLQTVRTDPRETAAYFLLGSLQKPKRVQIDLSDFSKSPALVERTRAIRDFGHAWLDSMYSDSDHALAVTSKSHRDEYQRFILSLVREGGRWLVEDVQIEPKEDEGEALQNFLEKYPDAKPVGQTNPTTEVGDTGGEAVNGVRVRLGGEKPLGLFYSDNTLWFEVENNSAEAIEFNLEPYAQKGTDKARWGYLEIEDANGKAVGYRWETEPFMETVKPGKPLRYDSFVYGSFLRKRRPGTYRARVTLVVRGLKSNESFKVTSNWHQFEVTLCGRATDFIPETAYDQLQEANAYLRMTGYGGAKGEEVFDRHKEIIEKYPNSKYALDSHFRIAKAASENRESNLVTASDYALSRKHYQEIIKRWPDVVTYHTIHARYQGYLRTPRFEESRIELYKWLNSLTTEQKMRSVRDYFVRPAPLSEEETQRALMSLNESIAAHIKALDRSLTEYKNAEQLKKVIEQLPGTSAAELAQQKIGEKFKTKDERLNWRRQQQTTDAQAEPGGAAQGRLIETLKEKWGGGFIQEIRSASGKFVVYVAPLNAEINDNGTTPWSRGLALASVDGELLWEKEIMHTGNVFLGEKGTVAVAQWILADDSRERPVPRSGDTIHIQLFDTTGKELGHYSLGAKSWFFHGSIVIGEFSSADDVFHFTPQVSGSPKDKISMERNGKVRVVGSTLDEVAVIEPSDHDTGHRRYEIFDSYGKKIGAGNLKTGEQLRSVKGMLMIESDDGDTGRLTSETPKWGEVSHDKQYRGIQCRLSAEKRVWKVGEIPKFSAEVRNVGNTKSSASVYPYSYALEYDGVMYYDRSASSKWASSVYLQPGQRLRPVTLSLEKYRKSVDQYDENGKRHRPPKLTPGKHIIRAAFPYESVSRVISNPVEIEILPSGSPWEAVLIDTASGDEANAMDDYLARLNIYGQGESSAANRSSGFGEVVEMVVKDISGGKDCLIDFDSGRLLSRPADWDNISDRKKKQWSKENGFDVVASVEKGMLYGRHLVVMPVQSYMWDTVSVDSLINSRAWKLIQQDALLNSHSDSRMCANEMLPVTYIFQTCEGGIGLLQFVGFEHGEQSDIKIRYKMADRTAQTKALEYDMRKHIASTGELGAFAHDCLRYAAAHNNVLPGSIGELKKEHSQERKWSDEDIAYVAAGKDLSKVDYPANVILAYNRSLRDRLGSTSLVFANGISRFVSADKLDKYLVDGAAHYSLAISEGFVYSADDNKVTLPTGLTIELLGVTNIPVKGKPFWRHDGSLLDPAPIDRVGYDPSKDPHRDLFDYCAVVTRFSGDAVDRVGGLIKWQMTGAMNAGGTSAYSGDKSVYPQNVHVAGARFLKRVAPTTDIRLGVASGKWKTIAAGKEHGFYENAGQIVVVGVFGLFGGPGAVFKRGPDICIGLNYNVGDNEFRVVAVDNSGEVHFSERSGGISHRGDLWRTNVVFPGLRYDQLKEFRFQVRPYEWAEFKNVSLRPGTDAAAKTPALSFEKVFEHSLRLGSSPATWAIDFDNNRIIPLPKRLDSFKLKEKWQGEVEIWCRQNGADALFPASIQGLLLIDATAFEVRAWDFLASPQTVLNEMMRGDAPFVQKLSIYHNILSSGGGMGTPRLPSTYFIHTRDGGFGIVELFKPAGSENIKFRYKMIETNPNLNPAVDIKPTPIRPIRNVWDMAQLFLETTTDGNFKKASLMCPPDAGAGLAAVKNWDLRTRKNLRQRLDWAGGITVYSDRKQALAFSQFGKLPDKRRMHLVIRLSKTFRWSVTHFDVATPEELDKEVDRFFSEHSQARKIDYKGNTVIESGRAVEGVWCELRPDRLIWNEGESPAFRADVYNGGYRKLHLIRHQAACEIQFDGRWYKYQGELAAKSSPFPLGRGYQAIPITLDKHWVTKRKQKPLGLRPGVHSVRVTFTAEPDDGGQPVRVPSNVVEINILRRHAKFGKAVRTGEIYRQIQKLKVDDPSQRADAIKKLGLMGENAVQAIPFLIESLTDRGALDGPDGRRFPQRGGGESMVRGSEEQPPPGRLAAVALGNIGRPAVKPLIEAIRNHFPVYDGLAGYRAKMYGPEHHGNVGVENAQSALVKIGVPAVESLIAGLDDDERLVRIVAVLALGRIKDARGVKPLIAALKDKDKYVRKGAASALGLIADARAVEPLIAVLQNPNGDTATRAQVARALGYIGDNRAVAPLIAALESAELENQIRINAASALGYIGDAAAVEPLIKALKDNDLKLRGRAASSLGKIGDIRALEPLTNALDHPDKDARESIDYAIRTIKAKHPDETSSKIQQLIEQLKVDDPDKRADAAGKLGEMGEKAIPAIPALIECLGDQRTAEGHSLRLLISSSMPPDEEMPDSLAAWALGEIGAPAVAPLIEALRNQYPVPKDAAAHGRSSRIGRYGPGYGHSTGRWNVERALANIGVPAVEPLIAVLDDDDRLLRITAAWVLLRIKEPRAAEPLIAVLADEDKYLRKAAAYALGQIGETKAFGPLLETLNQDTDWQVRANAAMALGYLGDKRAAAPLIAALQNEKEFTGAVSSSRHWEFDVRRSAASALGELGDSRAVGPLIESLAGDDLGIRCLAVNALGRIGDPRAIEPLLAALDDPEEGVRTRASRALGKIKAEYTKTRPWPEEYDYDSQVNLADGFEINLSTDKARYKHHEPVELTVTLTNKTNEEIKFHQPDKQKRVFWLSMKYPNGGSSLDQFRRAHDLFTTDPVIIKPGESVRSTKLLEPYYLGKHTINGSLRLRLTPDIFQGKLIARPISFIIEESADSKTLFKAKFDRLIALCKREFKAHGTYRFSRLSRLGPEVKEYLLNEIEKAEDPEFQRRLESALRRIEESR